MSERPDLSIIVPTVSGAATLPMCLYSALAQEGLDVQLIVVDNGADAATRAALEPFAERAEVICMGRNTGFGVAINAGLTRARGQAIMLLNDDARLEPDTAPKMIACLDVPHRVGMVAAKIMRAKPPHDIDKLGHRMYPDGQNRGFGTGHPDDGRYQGVQETLWADGCAALYARELVEEVGGFDEDLFAYADDSDYGLHAQRLGWTAVAEPRAVVWHHHSQTLGAYSPRKLFLVERNRILLVMKHFPVRMLLAAPFYSLYRYAWQAWAVWHGHGAAARSAGAHGRWRPALAILAAWADSWRLLPAMWAKRRAIRRRARVGDARIAALLRRFSISARELAEHD